MGRLVNFYTTPNGVSLAFDTECDAYVVYGGEERAPRALFVDEREAKCCARRLDRDAATTQHGYSRD